MELTAVLQATGKTTTGVVVPDADVVGLGAGKRPKVRVTLNGYTWRTSIAPMGGQYWLGLSRENRDGAGVAAGEVLTLLIDVDDAPREVEVPADLAAALAATPAAAAAFGALSYSNQRRHVLALEAAKKPETRARRVESIVAELTA